MLAVPLEGSYNARAIGAAHRPWLVRSAALDALRPAGERALRALGVDRVLDLREPSERRPPAHGLPVLRVPLYGEEPPVTGSLESVYAGLLRDRGERIAEAVVAIAEHPGTGVVHCTAGKDRTGLVVALARLAAGEDRAEVVADYVRSGAVVRRERAGLVAARLDASGLADPRRRSERAEAERLHLDSPAEALVATLRLLEPWGGARGYLGAHGASAAHLAALARRAEVGAIAPAPGEAS